MVRENDLNAELEQTRNEYESQIRDQNRELRTLRSQMADPSEAEVSLKQQVRRCIVFS